MNKRIVWLVVSGLVVVVLLVAACAPATEKKETAPAAPSSPVVKETAPVVPAEEKPVVAGEKVVAAEFAGKITPGKPEIKVSLTKIDGTVVEKMVEKPKYGGTLTWYQGGTILAWDEAYQAPWSTPNLGPTNQDLVHMDWKRGYSGTGEVSLQLHDWFTVKYVTGELVESWEFPDDQTIIYHVRKGVRWGLNPNSEASRLVGGRELTADDVAFNLKRIYFDIPTSTMYGMIGVSKPLDVYAQDKYTVVMKAPKGNLGKTFQEVSDLTKIVPPEVVKKYGDMNKWENVVGTGPFMLTDYVSMSSALWKKNTNYWEYDPVLGSDYRLPYVDTLRLLIIPDRSTQMAALRTGKVDASPPTPTSFKLEDAKQLWKTNPNLDWAKLPSHGSWPLGFRVDNPKLPTYDIRVRRALMMAINVAEIRDTYFSGDQALSAGDIADTTEFRQIGWFTPIDKYPPAPDGFDNTKLFTYHPEEARKLLAEAGYPNGFKTEVLLSSSSVEQMDLAMILKDYWARNLNVELTLDVRESAIVNSLYQKKTFKDMYWGGRGGMADSMYMSRKGNMYNWALGDDPKMDEYYSKITAAFFDDATKAKLMREMDWYMTSQVWYYFVTRPYTYRFWQPWVRGYHGEMGPGPYNYGDVYKYLWIDPDLKKSLGF